MNAAARCFRPSGRLDLERYENIEATNELLKQSVIIHLILLYCVNNGIVIRN